MTEPLAQDYWESAMKQFETLEVSVEGPLGRLELARPKRLNALSRQTLSELAHAARWFDEQRDVKVVVVSGQGTSFSAGFDLNDFANHDPNFGVRESADLGRFQGNCIGGGVVLAASCDLRVSSASAVFCIPEVDLGIPLAWGGIPRLVREIGTCSNKGACTDVSQVWPR
jgi:enoyl-CoA hydratase/carnithine racemase